MELLLNFGLAWVSVLLTVLLVIIYFLRTAIKKSRSGMDTTKSINRGLRKYHIHMGVALVITGLVHGLYSSEKVWTFNLGTLAWIASILLGLNWMFRKQFRKIWGWMFYHQLLSILFAGLIFWHVVDVGGIQVQHILFDRSVVSRTVSPNASINLTQDQINALPNANLNPKSTTYKDGTYTGVADAFRPGLTVTVTIKSNQITSVVVTQHNEVNARYYATPIQVIPQRIIQNQTTDVDTITGATFTSVGIINAVNDALADALVSGQVPANKTLPRSSGKGDRFR